MHYCPSPNWRVAHSGLLVRAFAHHPIEAAVGKVEVMLPVKGVRVPGVPCFAPIRLLLESDSAITAAVKSHCQAASPRRCIGGLLRPSAAPTGLFYKLPAVCCASNDAGLSSVCHGSAAAAALRDHIAASRCLGGGGGVVSWRGGGRAILDWLRRLRLRLLLLE